MALAISGDKRDETAIWPSLSRRGDQAACERDRLIRALAFTRDFVDVGLEDDKPVGLFRLPGPPGARAHRTGPQRDRVASTVAVSLVWRKRL